MKKNAFTLIEVMIAVVIISVVIMALLEMFANNTHTFLSLKKQTNANQYSSLLIANKQYGFEDKDIHFDDLIADFRVDDDLRRELKEIKVNIIYQELELIKMNEQEAEQEEGEEIQQMPTITFEVGKSVLKTKDSSVALYRLRVQ